MNKADLSMRWLSGGHKKGLRMHGYRFASITKGSKRKKWSPCRLGTFKVGKGKPGQAEPTDSAAIKSRRKSAQVCAGKGLKDAVK